MAKAVWPVPTAVPLSVESWPLDPKTRVCGAVQRGWAAPVTVPCIDQVSAAVGVRVSVTGTWLPSESYIVVVMTTGLVALDGRFPPRTTFCVWAGGPVEPTTTLSGVGGAVVGCPGAHPSTSPPLLVARLPLLSIWRSPSSV